MDKSPGPKADSSANAADNAPLGAAAFGALGSAGSAQGAAVPGSCRVLTYNLNIMPFGIRLQPAHDYKDDRLVDFVEAVRSPPPSHRRFDVLLLQEVYSSPFVPRLARHRLCRQQQLVAKLKEAGFPHHAVPKQPSVLGMLSRMRGTDTGLIIVSRHPISERASHVLRTDSGAPRGALFAKVDVPGGPALLCFSVRLPMHSTSEQIEEIRQFISGIAHRHPACPVALGGDLGMNAILQPAQRDAHGFIYDGSTRESRRYGEVVSHLDRQGRFRDVVLEAYGQHVPSRPADAAPMEVDSSLTVQQHSARTDFLFVSSTVTAPAPLGLPGLRAHTPGADLDEPLVALTASSPPTPTMTPPGTSAAVPVACEATAVVRFPALEGRPYKYLSDHFGVASTVSVPALARAGNLGANGAATPIHGRGDASTPIPTGTNDAVPAMKEHEGLSSWLRRGHTVNEFMVSGWEVMVFALLLWASIWAALTFLVAYAVFCVGQQLLPKNDPERPFGFVTESVKAGVAPIELPALKTAGKRGTAPTPAQNRPAVPSTLANALTFASAWRATVRNRAWLPCVGRIEDSNAPGGSRVTWLTVEDVDRAATDIVRGLRSLGLGRGSRIGILADPSADVLVLDIACLLAGVATVPLSGDPSTVRCQLQTCSCEFAVCTRSRFDQLLDSRASLRTVIVADLAAEMTRTGSSVAAAAMEERLKRAATDKGVRLLSVTQLADLSKDAGGRLPDVRASDGASAHCDVGEEVPLGAERSASMRVIDNRRLMAMLAQVDACRVLEPDGAAQQVDPGVDIRSPANVGGSQHRLDSRRGSLDTRRGPLGRDRGRNGTLNGTGGTSAKLKAALFPSRGCMLAHSGFSDSLERLSCLTAMLVGVPVVASRPTHSFFDNCNAARPTVVFVTPGTLYSLRAQTAAMLARYRKWYIALYRTAFALRLRLKGPARDLLRFAFRRTEEQFGGNLTTLVVPTLEGIPFQLRDFATVSIAPRLREVAFVHDCGVIAVNGVPPPSTLVRVVEMHSAGRPGMSDVGEITVSGPAVLPDAKGSTGWAHTGVMGRWVGNSLGTICNRDGLLWPMLDALVAAPQLEREYLSQSRLAANLFITCRPMRPLIAVVVPRRDVVEEVAAQRQNVGVGQLPWADFVRVARPLVLEELERIARDSNMPFAHIVRAVHLHQHPFAQHTSFLSQHLTLRRNRIARYFEAAIDALYSDLGRRHRAGEATDDDEQLASTSLTTGSESQTSEPRRPNSPARSSPSGPRFPGSPNRRQPSSRRSGSSRAFALEPAAPLAIDIGGTVAKVAYFQPPRGTIALPPYCEDEAAPEDMRSLFRVNRERFFTKEGQQRHSPRPGGFGGDNGDDDEEGSAVGALRFLRFPTNRVAEFLSAMRDQGAVSTYTAECLAAIPATGGGAHRFTSGVEEALGGRVKMRAVKEMESIIRGMQLCVESAQNCIFAYDWRELSPVPHRLSVSPSAGIYPFMVVNIGSGVSIVKCVAPDVPHVRVGGTPIGGGTFWGLARALTNVRTWDDVKELTRLDGPGDHTNVDLLVGDIYGFNTHDLPQRLTVDTVASCFGKLGTTRPSGPGGDIEDGDVGSASGPGSGVGTPVLGNSPGAFPAPGPAGGQLGSAPTSYPASPAGPKPAGPTGGQEARTRAAQPVDIVRSLLLMVATNVTQIAHLVCQAEHVENIFFTGGFVRDNEVVWRHISRMLDYWSHSALTAHFIQSDGFLGVMGALAATSTSVPLDDAHRAAPATAPPSSGSSGAARRDLPEGIPKPSEELKLPRRPRGTRPVRDAAAPASPDEVFSPAKLASTMTPSSPTSTGGVASPDSEAQGTDADAVASATSNVLAT